MQLVKEEVLDMGIFDEEILTQEEQLAERMYRFSGDCHCGNCMTCLGIKLKDFF